MEKKTSKSNNEKRNGRMIHVRLPEEVHKRLRIKVAEDDTTIQDWVAAVVAIELERQGKRK
jgi:predicted HicB family RNase H-like nuclease